MTAQTEILRLNRRFIEMSDSGAEITEAQIAALSLLKGQPWPEVLKARCAVILGEAGSGKTTEFRQRYDILLELGSTAFLVTVDDLATSTLEGSLDSQSQERFVSWKAEAESEAIFFLDAVDEARLLNGRSFSAALRHLEQAVGTRMARAHVMISCRVSDWHARADIEEINRQLFPSRVERSADRGTIRELGFNASGTIGGLTSRSPPEGGPATANNVSSPSKQPARPAIVVYALAPLSAEQIERLAASLGVANVTAFTSAAAKAGAHVYLERPRDVQWLAAYWLRHGTLGSLTELIENDVREKLIERNPNRTLSISHVKARVAAEVLAGVSVLENKSTFLLPDNDLNAARFADALDPATTLSDLKGKEISDVLTLALFDEATYGRVRIHHRTAREYLAAKWLEALLDVGLLRSEVEAVLFRSGPAGYVVPQELVAVAAWLAAFSPAIRKRLMEIAPLVLLEGGDPNSFLPEERRALLEALAAKYHGREHLFQSFDRTTLARLANGSIEQTINELLKTATSDELLDTLLTIVGEGQLRGCAEEVLRVAITSAALSNARHEAVRAASTTFSGERMDRMLAVLIDQSTEIDQELGATIVASLYPEALGLGRLLTLLGRAKVRRRHASSTLAYFLSEKVYPDTKEADRVPLILGILDLIRVPEQPKQTKQTWLLDPLAKITLSYARANHDVLAIEPAIRFFIGLGPHRGFSTGSADGIVRELAILGPRIRQMMFWMHIDVARSQKKICTYRDVLMSAPLWSIDESDLEWLARDARERQSPADRLLAFDMLGNMSIKSRSRDRDETVAEIVRTNPSARRRYERSIAKQRTVVAEPIWIQQQRVREQRIAEEHGSEVQWLHEHIMSLQDGTNGHALAVLAQRSDLDPDSPEKALKKLAEEFDQQIADATREGWRVLWRTIPCPMPHEEPQRNTFSYSIIVGLAGLTLDINAGLDFSTLTPSEAQLAARYATRSMNHFPNWLGALVARSPGAVKTIFSATITADYANPPEAVAVYNVLYLLSSAPKEVRELCAPIVLELLRVGDPPRFDALQQSVEALIASESQHERLCALAIERAISVSDAERFSLWWCAWFAVKPAAALDTLVVAIGGKDNADALVLAVCDRMWRLVEDTRIHFPVPQAAPLLARLATIVFAHVRPEEDVEHNGTFSPGARDHAESLRRALLERIANTPGQATFLALQGMAADPRLGRSRDYLLTLAERRVAQDAGQAHPDVARRLVQAFRKYGLGAFAHLQEAGLKTLTSSKADFGIVTALPEELHAVLAQLDTWEKLDKEEGDTHTYYQTTLQTTRRNGDVYRLVLVCAPKYGPEYAVATTSALLHRWKPRHIVLVGIALGLEGETSHGDILIADQVVDYLLGKKETGKKRVIRPEVHRAGASVFESAQHVALTWSKSIRAPRPAAGEPTLRIGTVMSGGDVVLDDELLAEFLVGWPKLVGVEMEAGGAATAVHDDPNKAEFLMIKAVSDHGKDKHDPAVKPWRPYACAAAAAFAIELIRSGPSPAVHTT